MTPTSSSCYIFVGSIVRSFLTDQTAIDFGISFARILLSTSFLFGLYYVILSSIQAKGDATAALIVNISRQGIIYIPVMFVLGMVFKATGLVLAQPVTDVISLDLAIYLHVRSEKRVTMQQNTKIEQP